MKDDCSISGKELKQNLLYQKNKDEKKCSSSLTMNSNQSTSNSPNKNRGISQNSEIPKPINSPKPKNDIENLEELLKQIHPFETNFGEKGNHYPSTNPNGENPNLLNIQLQKSINNKVLGNQKDSPQRKKKDLKNYSESSVEKNDKYNNGSPLGLVESVGNGLANELEKPKEIRPPSIQTENEGNRTKPSTGFCETRSIIGQKPIPKFIVKKRKRNKSSKRKKKINRPKNQAVVEYINKYYGINENIEDQQNIKEFLNMMRKNSKNKRKNEKDNIKRRVITTLVRVITNLLKMERNLIPYESYGKKGSNSFYKQIFNKSLKTIAEENNISIEIDSDEQNKNWFDMTLSNVIKEIKKLYNKNNLNLYNNSSLPLKYFIDIILGKEERKLLNSERSENNEEKKNVKKYIFAILETMFDMHEKIILESLINKIEIILKKRVFLLIFHPIILNK